MTKWKFPLISYFIDYFGGFPNLSLSLSFMKAPSQAMGRFAASGHRMLTSLSGLNEGFNAVQNNYLTALLDGVLPSTHLHNVWFTF